MADTDEEKTESATAKRRHEAREEGQVARSPEVLTAFVLGAGVLGLWVSSGFMYDELAALARALLRRAATPELSTDGFFGLAVQVTAVLVRVLAPVFVAALLGGVAGNLVQVGFLVSFKSITPNPSRLDPISGFKNLFQKAKIIDLGKSVLKIAAVGWAAYLAVKERLPEFPFLSDLPPAALLIYQLQLGFEVLKNVLLVYVLIALLDYAFQRWQFEEKIKMTKQSVKEEYKESEGDPLIKGRIRSLQREMARRRMMAEVPRADVVVTNPTHLAVALRYDPAEMDAPRLVAKGADRVAERIIELAQEHGVPRYQAVPVARALFAQVEIGEAIPADLFQVVAEILAHVYRLRQEPPAR
ncbi:MAG: flagellar biosynthesis protein FlhB [Deferrisomatales bacterium]